MSTLVNPDECYFCGLKRSYNNKSSRSLIELHHIVSKKSGGTNESANLLPVCSNHHSLIHMGFIIPIRFYNSTRGFLLYWKDNFDNEHYGR